jgi:biotin-(acetyl-CoA carboxylase) ligase
MQYELYPLLHDFIAFMRSGLAVGVIHTEALDKAYLQRLWKLGQWVDFVNSNGECIRAIPKNIDDYGRLLVETHQGRRTFDFGEVSYRPASK